MSVWSKVDRQFGSIRGLDGSAEWLLDENAGQNLFLRKGLGQGATATPPFAFLVQPTKPRTGERLLSQLLDVPRDGARFNMSAADRARLIANQTAGALCDASFVRAMIGRDFGNADKAMQLSSAMPSNAAPEPDAAPFEVPDGLAAALQDPFDHTSVVIGVIDDGFAIAHPRLRLAKKKTRVLSFWDQEAAFTGANSTVPFGRELLKVDFGGTSGLDEILDGYDGPYAEIYGDQRLSAFYPKTRNLMPRNTSHGTGVLDLLGGAKMGEGARQPVVAVKLPRSSVLDTSGAHLDFFLLEGIRHILSRADMLTGQDDPHVVIAMSYGYFGGPLDGSSLFERTLDAILETPQRKKRVQIVIPSGNGRMNRAHAVRPDPGTEGDVRTIKWRSPAGDRTPSVMEVWTDVIIGDATAPSVKIRVKPPDGKGSGFIDFTDVNTTEKLVLSRDDPAGIAGTGDTTDIMAEVVCDHPPLHPGRRRFMIWLSPTALPPPDVDAPPALSASGIWTVRLETLAPTATELSIWIRRDDSLPGYPTLGRQSSVERDPPQEGPIPLNQDQWDRWDDYGTASVTGTINTIATGQYPVVTCGFGAANQRAAASAAGGPLTAMAVGAPAKPADPTGRWVGPDCLAPSQVTHLRGIKAANFFGGSKVSMSGTSFAAPLTGHWLAGLYLQGTSEIDGKAHVRAAAATSDAAMAAQWKPRIARGDNRFLTHEMRQRTFKYDGVD